MSTLTLKELSAPTGEVIKIAAGKTLDLKSQGSVTMPTGSVLQVVSVQGALVSTVSVTSFTDVIKASITPKSSSSTITIQVVMRWQEAASTTSFKARLFDKTNSTLVNGGGPYGQYNSGSTNVISMYPMNGVVSNTTTTAREYSFQVYRIGNAVSIDVNGYETTLIITEIQG